MIAPFAIDVHTHLGATCGFRPYYATVDDFVGLMDAMGTRLSIAIPMPLLNQQFELGYQEAEETMRRHQGRILAYGVFDPNWPDISLRLLERYLARPGFVGVKIHPTAHATAPEDRRYQEFWDFAEERQLVVLTHTWNPDPVRPMQNKATADRFALILESHPNLRLILGHCGGNHVGMERAVYILKRFPNVWADLSGDNFTMGRLEWLAAQVGAGRLLYGTDSNWIEPRYLLGYILKSKLSVDDRYAILRENALSLFGDKLADEVMESATIGGTVDHA